jgi:hypothetical protein
VLARYVEWCRLNRGVLWHTRSLSAFIATVRCQLAAGSAKNHVRALLVLERRRSMPPERVFLTNALAVVEAGYAKEGTEPTADFEDDAQALRALRAVARDGSPTDFHAAQMMLLFGLRLADVMNLDVRHCSIFPASGSATVDLLLTKNRRSTGKREVIRYQKMHLQPVRAELASLARFLASATGYAFESVSAEKITEGLRTVAEGTTPGSLRRRFIHRIIAMNESRSGEVDWAAVAAVTAHFNVTTLKAFYERRSPR